MANLNAHITYEPSADAMTQLRSRLQEGINLTTGETVAPDTHVLIAGRPTDEQLQASEVLAAVLIPFAGLPDVTREKMRNYPHLSVHNLHHNAPMTAEMAIALLMAAARTIIPADLELRMGNWTSRYEQDKAPYKGVVLQGKTALILGYGEVGRRVADVLRALGMEIIATKRTPLVDAVPDDIYKPESLGDILMHADVLMVCLPATPETEGLIGVNELYQLPQNAIVVNVGRGNIIDQYALYAALKSGHLHSAGLDVWYNYPKDKEAQKQTFPADVPFWELPNVVMSPHRGGGGGIDEVEIRRMNALAESLNIGLETGYLPHEVDLEAGY